MIVFFYGTTAEAIKVAPVMHELDKRGIPYEQWLSLQQADTMLRMLPGLKIAEPNEIIVNGINGRPLRNIFDSFIWFSKILFWALTNKSQIRKRFDLNKSVMVVHGDTTSSVVGMLVAKYLGLQVAHVEAGLRSGNWRSPFPEELNRRLLGKTANIHYAPSRIAEKALSGKKNVIFTDGNTALDALVDRITGVDPLPGEYGFVALHRTELVSNADLLLRTFQELNEFSPVPLRILLNGFAEGPTMNAISKIQSDKLSLVSKLDDDEFMPMLLGASFVVTDSGGLQEELAFLGIPMLLHRITTERQDGIGENVVVSFWKTEILTDFLSEYKSHRRALRQLKISPSEVIAEDLISREFGN